MIKEDLAADMDKVKVWSEHKNGLIKSYKLIDPTTRGPFLIYNNHESSLLVNMPQNIKKVLNDLDNFFLELQINKINRILNLEVGKFKWKNTGILIQSYLRDKINISSINDLILFFLNLNETYKDVSKEISDNYSKLIKDVSSNILVKVKKDNERYKKLSDLLNQWKGNKSEADEDDDELEIESEDFEEKIEQVTPDFEIELYNKIKSLCRKQALKKFGSDTFNKNDKVLLVVIREIEQHADYDEIGQAAFFKKHFERITKGVEANILKEIPMAYKRFRKEQLDSKSKNWNLETLQILVKKDNNTRIHIDEQALLLKFVNNYCYVLAKNFKDQFKDINHSYINAYKSNTKPVIGVDEATDFSIIDLLAINSFRHPELSSVTFSGDIMQRMTNEGLKSWNHISKLIPDCEIMDLKISYRQSPTLLSLAQSIYDKSTTTGLKYESYIEKDDSEPMPKVLVSDNEDNKLNWLAERIHDIYMAHKYSIPSIAIFLSDESQIESFSKKLGTLSVLFDFGIKVVACRDGSVLGNKDTVRVFSITNIKGLEFEAVFFHDMDTLLSQKISKDSLLKYLYVGLSRATLFLGITLSQEFKGQLEFLSKSFDGSSKNWI
jgi:hypothetical protein